MPAPPCDDSASWMSSWSITKPTLHCLASQCCTSLRPTYQEECEEKSVTFLGKFLSLYYLRQGKGPVPLQFLLATKAFKGAFTPTVNASLAWMGMWRNVVTWLREKIELHSHQAAVQSVKSGQTWPSLLVAGLLLRCVVFEDHENAFPCSVTSLQKADSYPPRKLKCVIKLLTTVWTWVRSPEATADQRQCSFFVAAPPSSTSQS